MIIMNLMPATCVIIFKERNIEKPLIEVIKVEVAQQSEVSVDISWLGIVLLAHVSKYLSALMVLSQCAIDPCHGH